MTEYDELRKLAEAQRVRSALEAAIRSGLPHAQGEPVTTYQDRVKAAHVALFDGDPTDLSERRDRFFEEAAETVQAFGMTEDDAIALVRYTFSRPVGEPRLEVGAAKLTLTSLCVEASLDLMECAEAELAKLVKPETIARIRAKRATRHGRGPLPGFSPPSRAALTEEGR